MANELVVSDLAREVAATYRVTPDDLIRTVKSTCFPAGAASDAQLVVFLNASRKLELDPLNREIYAFLDKDGRMQIIVGLDGWIKLATRNPQFAGFEFIDQKNEHGQVEAITCRMWRRDWTRPGEATEYLAECKGNTTPWTKWPHRMLRNKAYIQCARLTFGFAGAIDDDEVVRIHDAEKWVDQNTGEVVGATPPADLNGANAELRTIADAEVVPTETPPEQTAPSSVVVAPLEPEPAAAPEPEQPKTRKPREKKPEQVAAGRARLKELADRLPTNRIVILCGQMGCEKIEDFNDEQVATAIARLEKRAS